MHRLACVFVVVAAGCSGGTGTGAATLTGSQLAVKSSFSKPFSGLDANGKSVLAWKIDFVSAGPGADCTDGSLKIAASIAVFTSQAAGGTQKVALLNDGDDFVITQTIPPPTAGNGAANMVVSGVGNISGDVNFPAIDKNPDGSIFELEGMLTAAGTDNNGATVNMTGTFKAPLCKS